MSTAMICWNCAAVLDQVLLPVSRHEYCPACSEAVHCCRLCVHYAPSRAESCAEDRAEPPTNKETANFCDFFSPMRGASRATQEDEAQAKARAKLDALFGGSGDSGRQDG